MSLTRLLRLPYTAHNADCFLQAQQFSIGQIKCLMQQLLEGVAFLHHRWVIHRDLKTSNLLYSNNGQLKICDFGLARQFGDPLSPYTPMVSLKCWHMNSLVSVV